MAKPPSTRRRDQYGTRWRRWIIHLTLSDNECMHTLDPEGAAPSDELPLTDLPRNMVARRSLDIYRHARWDGPASRRRS
eukprot:983766-Prymnesium_polylepis.1